MRALQLRSRVMDSQPRPGYSPRYATQPIWTETVLANLDHFLLDHAAAEKSLRHGHVDGVPLPGQNRHSHRHGGSSSLRSWRTLNRWSKSS